jgi:hypothetical protein
MKAALRAGPLFDSFGLNVRVVRLPPEHDPDTNVRAFGPEGFAQVLAEAPALAQYRIEATLGDALGGARMEREEAISQAARIIAELSDEGERSVYIGSLAQKVAQASGSLDRLATIEESIRKRVQTSQVELRRESSNQRRREAERAAVQERLREKSSGEVIALPQRQNTQNLQGTPRRQDEPHGDDDGHKYLQPDDGPASESSGEVIPFTPRARPKRDWVPDTEWRARGDWKKREAPTHNSIEGALPAEEAGGTDTIAARKLANVAMGDDSGVVKAERALLGAMLNAPSLRQSLAARLSAAMWTREVHFEIASRLKSMAEDEPVDPPRLLEELSPEAASLVADLLLTKTMESTEPHVLDDYIKRVNAHHAKRREHENLQILLQKMMDAEPGSPLTEPIEPEDKARFEESARETKRMLPPE